MWQRQCYSHGTNGRSDRGQRLRKAYFFLQRLFEYVSGSTKWALVESISRLVKVDVTFWENTEKNVRSLPERWVYVWHCSG